MDTLFEIFRFTVDKGKNPFQFKLNSQYDLEELATSDMDIFSRRKQPNLMFTYLSALLISFIDVGLIEVCGQEFLSINFFKFGCFRHWLIWAHAI